MKGFLFLLLIIFVKLCNEEIEKYIMKIYPKEIQEEKEIEKEKEILKELEDLMVNEKEIEKKKNKK
jgi:hypothetical protein